MTKDEIIIYKNEAGLPVIEVAIKNETLWLTQKQIADIFGTQVPAINKHIKNIYQDKELDKTTISKMEIVRVEGVRQVKRTVDIYSLDMVLSIGYRVNSIKATQFRIWANQILKDYLLNGYAINHKKLQEQSQQLVELKQTIKLIGAVQNNYLLNHDELKDTFKILTDYVYALDVLDRYDHQQLENEVSGHRGDFKIDYDSALKP